MPNENNNKNVALKSALNVLLKEVEQEKQKFAPSKPYFFNDDKIIHPYFPRTKFEILDKAFHILIALMEQFHSVEDSNSVKKLREAEIYFSFNVDLKKMFIFPNYKSLVDPKLLERVNVEIQLENLTKKAKELNARGHKKAFGEIMGVVLSVDKSVKHHFQKGENNNFNHMNLALAIIELAIPTIDQHLAWEMILLNLSLLIFTLGTAHIGNKIVNNHFLFYKETETHKQLVELGNTVSKLTV